MTAEGCSAVATTPTAPTVDVGVAAVAVAGCVEFDSGSAGVDEARSASGAGVAGGVGLVGAGASPEAVGSLDWGGVSTPLASSRGSGLVDVGAVGASDSVVLVCAPPLLPMVTPDATWSDEDVVPDVVAVPVAVESAPVVAVDEVVVPVVDVAADPVDDSPDDASLDVELAEVVVDDSDDVPVVSAAANPWPVATAVTSHAATAMPPYPPSLAALWAALRDGVGSVGVLDEGDANNGLTGGWISVMGSTPMAVQWRG
jgi:hypothetical protein